MSKKNDNKTIELDGSVQAQWAKNRERHLTLMTAIQSLGSAVGITINDTDGSIAGYLDKVKTNVIHSMSLTDDSIEKLATKVTNKIPKPSPPKIIQATVDNSVHIANNQAVLDNTKQAWTTWIEQKRKDEKDWVMTQLDSAIKTYLKKRDEEEQKRLKENSLHRKVCRFFNTLYHGYVSDSAKHVIAYTISLLCLIFATFMYIGMVGYKASFDAEFEEYRTIRPFLVTDKAYIPTINAMKELAKREDCEDINATLDSIITSLKQKNQ